MQSGETREATLDWFSGGGGLNATNYPRVTGWLLWLLLLLLLVILCGWVGYNTGFAGIPIN